MQSKPLNETEVETGTKNTDTGESVTPPAAPVVVPPASPTPPSSEVDYRGKFAMSTRENQVLQGELEGLKKLIGDVTREEIPTDEEMIAKYPEFEFAEPAMQTVLKRQEVMDRRTKGIQVGVERTLASVTRRNEIAAVVSSDARLAGKEMKFMDFATDPRRSHAPVETLVSAFLFEAKDEAPIKEETPPPAPADVPAKPAHTLERGTPSGGSAPSATDTERSPEELQHLRTTNPREYNRLIREGKI